VLGGTSSCWMLSEEEDCSCSLEILGFEHVAPVSISLLENLKSWRTEIMLESGVICFLAETGHSQDCD